VSEGGAEGITKEHLEALLKQSFNKLTIHGEVIVSEVISRLSNLIELRLTYDSCWASSIAEKH
jgi:hypothetical protein